MMHELAHVIAGGPVESRTSTMNETLTHQTVASTRFGVGDLIGLPLPPPVPATGRPQA